MATPEEQTAAAIAGGDLQTRVFVGGIDEPQSHAFSQEFQDDSIFQNVDSLQPPNGDPHVLNDLFKLSYPLRACIDAMRANIATPGVTIAPCIDLDDTDGKVEFREAINVAHDMGESRFLEEQVLALLEATGAPPTAQMAASLVEDFEVSEGVFEASIRRLRRAQRIETFALEAFLESCCPNSSYYDLRDRTVADFEIHGYAFWEVILDYDLDQRPVQLKHLPAWTMRLGHQQKEAHFYKKVVAASPVVFKTKQVSDRFRLYMQRDAVSNRLVYYKMLEDARIYSAVTGEHYDSIDHLREKEGANARPANALIHFSQYDPENQYGSPRWLGVLCNILGTIAMEKTNQSWFENNTVPSGILSFTNMDITDEDMNKVRQNWTDTVKGKPHSIAMLASNVRRDPFQSGSQNPDVKFIPLQTQSQNDAQFMDYANRNVDVVGMVYRLGRPVRGDMRDLNRSTAKVAVQLAEKQVFQQVRSYMDIVISSQLLPALGIRHVKLLSNAPDMTDPEEIMSLLEASSKGGFLTIEEARQIVSKMLGRNFRRVEGEHGQLPTRLILGGYKIDDDGKLVPIVDGSAGGNTAPEGGENLQT